MDLKAFYFARDPGVKHYMDQTRQMAREQGFVETVFGRRLYLPDIRSRNAQMRQYAERSAINAPMQGTAADIIKRAMIEVDRWLQAEPLVRFMLESRPTVSGAVPTVWNDVLNHLDQHEGEGEHVGPRTRGAGAPEAAVSRGPTQGDDGPVRILPGVGPAMVTSLEKAGFRTTPSYDETVAWLKALIKAAVALNTAK